ncbi:MAG: amino acid adenylation domain-containing protein, partial [bacterium]|nr:amino acid adenylation domain-containing protein [bacterium]
LARLSGTWDVLVGTPIAGRTREEIEGLIGFFLNTLVLRVDLSDKPTFCELLRREGELNLAAFSHQEVPFEKILEELRPERDLARTPLFQVFFNMLDFPQQRLDLHGLTLETLSSPEPPSKFDLTIYASDQSAGMTMKWVYNADRFDRDRIAEMQAQYALLLEQIAAAPERRIDRFSLVTTAARERLPDPRQVLDDAWPGAVHQLFARRAEEDPERPAAVDPQTTRSYGELDRSSNRLAHRLLRGGLEKGEVVAIWAHRSAVLPEAVLGVLKGGGAFLLLDPVHPPARQIRCLEQAAPRALLHLVPAGALPSELEAWLEAHPVCRRCELPAAKLDGPEDDPGVAVAADDVAYVAFTSGSTGEPKGIVGCHRSLTHFTPWQQESFGLHADDRYSVLSGLSHDPLHREVFTPLQVGAVLCFPDPDHVPEPRRLVEWLERQRISIVHLTPAMGQLLGQGTPEPSGERLTALRYAFFVGDALTAEDVARLRDLAPRVQSVNYYGSTETQRAVGYYPVPEEGPESGREVLCLGRGMPDVQLLVLNRAGELAAIGEVGEIHVRSPHLARGYLGDAALTAERFLPNGAVLGGSGGEDAAGAGADRIYRTGDLGRYRPDGNLEFAGRTDFQIKLRGLRIEPGEVSANLDRHPAVRRSLVIERPLTAGESGLVAYLTAAGEVVPSVAELRSFLRRTLPEYMVPAAFVVLDQWPLTATGKIDRRALPDPEAVHRATAEYREPRSEPERRVAAVWKELLAVDQVGIHDNFLDLGAHSLLMIRAHAQLRPILGDDLTLLDLFRYPTVSALVAARQAACPAPPAPGDEGLVGVGSVPPIVPDLEHRHQPFPLNAVQQAYWIGRSAALELGNVACHSYRERELPALDVRRFNRALVCLIDRHDMLRAVIGSDGRQRILEQVPPYEIRVLDLRRLPSARAEEALAAVRAEMSHQVLPADRWPLFDLRLTLLDGGKARLHLSLDLLITDAWSTGIISREIFRFYEDPDLDPPPLELSFRDCVLAEEALGSSELYRRAEEYWQRRIPTLPPAPELPLARSPSAVTRPRFVRRRATLDQELWDRLKARAGQVGLTPSGLLLAAFSEVLAGWSKSPHFTLNLTLFNRPPLHPQINEVVGDFTTLTLMEVDAARPGSFEVRARAVQERLWQDLEHRQVGGVEVLRRLARSRGRGANPMMPVVFTSLLIADAGEENRPPETATKEVYGITQTPQVWLDHQVTERAGYLSFNWDAVEELFPAGLLDAMFETYRGLLRRLAEDEEAWRAAGGLPLPESELVARTEANATTASVPPGLLHEGFLRQARERPEQLAVIAGDRRLSYGWLARRSGRLAAALRHRGVRPNQLVAVVMEKGWEQVAAVLGILRAGAAYLPVDAALPRQRRDHLLHHGEVGIALTQPWLDRNLEWPPGIERLTVAEEASAPADTEPEPGTVGQPDDLAYVIYTSGSTGEPKGVMIDHQAALNTVIDVNRRFAMASQDRVLGISSLSFDLSVWDLFGTLTAGGTLVLPAPAARRDPQHWLELMERHAVTVWNSVPALLEMLVEFVAGNPRSVDVARTTAAAGRPDLRLALLSGDWIPVTLPDRLRSFAPDVEVVSLGGATEAAIWSIFHPIVEVDPTATSIPYGRPLTNQRFHVLDHALGARPVWVPGELYIAGSGLARGYWRDPGRTAASFFEHPRRGERLYRTGDLGRYLPDGTIEFLGREDLQVKIQGHRIELGEIEAILEQHPHVRAGVALAVGPERGGRRLVAYVVTDADGGADAEELHDFLSARLPAPMVPSAFELLDELPLTATGKVDRKALAERAVVPAVPAVPAVGVELSRTPVEARLSSLLSELLDVEQVGVHDSLFDLGGNSLTAIQLLNRIQQELGVEIPLRRLFEAPTAAELAQMVDRARLERAPESIAEFDHYAITPDLAHRHQPFPLNEVQQAYWLGRSDAFQLGNVAAHSYRETDLDELDVERMGRVLERLVDRHDMLRTIVMEDATQQILAQVPVYRMPVLDLRAGSAAAVEQRLLEVREEMSHQVLRADRWPVFDVRVTLLPGGRARLHLSLDILFMDAWSARILQREVALLYHNPEAELEPLQLSFRDYVLAEAAFAGSELYARSREYWWRRLPELPPAPELPLTGSPRSLDRPRFSRRRASLSAAAWGRIKRRAGRLGLTPSGLLLAAFAEVLARWSKSPRFTLNVTTFNRLPLHPQVNDVVGDFTTLTLVAIDMSHGRGSSFELRARTVQEQLWTDLEHRFIGGVRVLRELARIRGQMSGALLPVVFTSMLVEAGGRTEEAAAGEGEAAGGVARGGFAISQTPQVWLDHQIREHNARLVWSWDAVEDLFPAAVLDRMFDAYHRLLLDLAEAESWRSPAL